jgi:hypothetical protein
MTEKSDSRPVRYALIDRFGKERGRFDNAIQAVAAAHRYWPDQAQDGDREGRGWDIEAVR